MSRLALILFLCSTSSVLAEEGLMAPNEEFVLIEMLKLLRPPYSQDVFNAYCSTFPTIAIERAIFTPEGRIVLLPRSPTDPWFAGKVHIPGSVMLQGEAEETVFHRAGREIGAGELPGVFIDRLHFPKGEGPGENPRGQETALLFGSELPADYVLPPQALLAFPGSLPENIIGFHKKLVGRAAEWRMRHF